jgi:putative transposase
MKPPPDPHYRHRFPAEIISHAVWLYHVFGLSLRDVELLLAERGIVVSYETVRRWCKKFGQSFADRLRRRRPRPGDKWHMDEVFIRIRGVQHYLWRAVDQDGVVLDIMVQARRDANAAKRFFKRLLKGLLYVPRVIVTDKLRSYGVAQRTLLPDVEHRQSRYLNNRAENSHRPTRRRERQMQRFKSPEQAHAFLSRSRVHSWPLPSTPTPHASRRISRDPIHGVQCLAAGDGRSASGVIDRATSLSAPHHHPKLT